MVLPASSFWRGIGAPAAAGAFPYKNLPNRRRSALPPYTIAHLSDPHLPLDGTPAWRDLVSKRFLSWRSWQRKRSAGHRTDVTQALLADLSAHRPDHVACTGDLVNLALPDEFGRARSWMTALGAPDKVTLVPGNHDALVRVAAADGLDLWSPWMQGDDGVGSFPFVRLRGEIALIGLSTAVPSLPLLAIGRLGPDQLQRLEQQLVDLGRRGLFRLVLIHHPIAEGVEHPRKALVDRAAVRAVLARAGAELVLHGHSHLPRLDPVPGPNGPIACIGVPSASAGAAGTRRAARWHLLRIGRGDDGGWQVGVTVRALSALEPPRFETIGDYRILVSTSA